MEAFMAKRITISIPDDLYEKLQEARNEYPDDFDKLSKICQRALIEAAEKAKAFNMFKNEGFLDGEKEFPKIGKNIADKIASVMSENDIKFRGLSLLEKVNLLMSSFEKKIEKLQKAFDLHDGKIILCDWAKYDEDKRSEAAWCYREGFFQGIFAAYKNQECQKRNI
jgi:hypothetical protein